MLNYIKAENLKCKRTFLRKNVFIAPISLLAITVLSPMWFQINAFNWWYVIIMPGFIALNCYLVHQREEKKLKYRAVLPLSVDLKRIWIAKNLIISMELLIATIILLTGAIVGGIIFPIANRIPILQAVIASILIVLTSLWQIPLCIFLSKKLGVFGVILINAVIGIFLNTKLSVVSLWWICPYSWTSRLMCPVLGILPSGLLAEAGDPLMNASVIPVGIIMSIALFILLILITAKWFEKQEVL